MDAFRINTMRALVCVLALLPFASGAATLYRCKAANAPVAYQDAPCAARAKTLSMLDYAPEPPSAPLTPSRTKKAALMSGHARGQGSGSTRARARDTRLAAVESCGEAKQRRDEWEREVGLRRRYDDLRAWNDRVRRACP